MQQPLHLADEIVKAVRARGSDATDVRDAAHEAHHALTLDVPPGKWDRETINRALEARWPGRRGASDRVSEEVTARAVEQAVCKVVGFEYDPAFWATIAFMETAKNGGIMVPSDFFAKAIEIRLCRPATKQAVERVLALPAIAFPFPKRRSGQ